MGSIDKAGLLATLIAQLNDELARAKAHALDAAEGATHEENRAEGDKDMRSTEASYVARGHAERTAKLEQAVALLTHLELKTFASGAAIEISALVELQHAKKKTTYFLVPAAGGERVAYGGKEILALSPTSPLGAALIGLSAGDEAEVESPQGMRAYEIVDVR
jgi:transcription elongation GreA/GreB family factor